MGAPHYQYRELFKKHDVKVFSSNYALYADLSERIMNQLYQFTPDLEIYSIDESFLEFKGERHFFCLEQTARTIRKKILKGIGIPVSIGLAPTKTLAKVANRIVKKYPNELKGIYSINTEEKRIKALKWLPIEDVWGIGKRLAARLREININTAYDFTQLSDQFVRKEFSIVELRLKKELDGESVLKLDEIKQKKSIATTRSFERDEYDYDFVKERLITFAVTCAEKLRKQKSNAKLISIFIQTNPQKDSPQYRRTIVLQLPFATNSNITLAKYAAMGLDQIYREGYGYKKAGIIVSEFSSANEKQLNIFDDEDPKHKPLMQTIDRLNQKLGETKLKLGAQDLQRTWKMKQNHLSKNYTTNINQLIEIDLNLA